MQEIIKFTSSLISKYLLLYQSKILTSPGLILLEASYYPPYVTCIFTILTTAKSSLQFQLSYLTQFLLSYQHLSNFFDLVTTTRAFAMQIRVTFSIIRNKFFFPFAPKSDKIVKICQFSSLNSCNRTQFF